MNQFCETLESRTHLSATLTGTRTPRIDATDNVATVVEVAMVSRKRFTISIDGVDQGKVFNIDSVRGLKFYGGDGDDIFRVTNLFKDVSIGRRESYLFTDRTTIVGGNGDDLLIDGYGGSRINGGNGNDTITGAGGADRIVGGAGNDYINAGADPSAAVQDDGSDIVFAGSGNDTVLGGNGKDVLFGQAGNDSLLGGNSRDALYGNSGIDFLDGQRDRNIEYAGGQLGDVIQSTNDDDLDKFAELRNMSTYLPRLIREYVLKDMIADANA